MNNFDNSFFSSMSPELFEKREREKYNLKKLGYYTGIAVLANIILQNMLFVVLELLGLSQKYYNDAVFSSGLDIIATVVSLLLPFVAANKKMSRYSGVKTAFYIGRPYRKSLMLPAIIAGVGLCMGANIISSYMVAVFNSFGYEPAMLDFNMPEGIGGFVLSVFRMAVVAGVVEEFALRGSVMGNLRYYGDGFAIVISSIIFGIIHGNFLQMPFALLAGFVMGYLSVKTGTIWTGIIIHIINNFMSVIFSYLPDVIGETNNNIAQAIVIYGLTGIGIAAITYFNNKTKDIPLNKGGSALDITEKARAYFFNAPLIISLIYFMAMSFLMIAETG